MEVLMITIQFGVSIVLSIVFSAGFICWQVIEYNANVKAISKLKNFFLKKETYATIQSAYVSPGTGKMDSSFIIKQVAVSSDSDFYFLIKDINDYIKKSKGTVAFSIIQNKTERRISMLYEIATSKLSFPTQIGLMGTFFGVFVGLIAFLVGTMSQEGITDSAIQSLITGVLVSMITSFCGIGLLIQSHRLASEASNQIDRDKNEFYEWVQNELMPSVDVSMVEAIGKLHETIDQFEPTFSGVIAEFKDAFRDVTGAFGTDFRESVKIVSSAVKKMGNNMDSINENIRLQDKLLTTIRSKELNKSMEAFVAASQKFSEITGSLDQFERARRLMLIAAQETINIQTSFNQSLEIPKQVASEINMILDRITTFEDNINKMGENLALSQTISEKTIKRIVQQIDAINRKQDAAKSYAESADEQLCKFYEDCNDRLGEIAKHYTESLENYLSDYENMLKERKSELEARTHEFTDAIDQKLSIDDIRTEFTSLKKLNFISDKIDQLVKTSVQGSQLAKALEKIQLEITALAAAQEKQGKGVIGSLVGSSNSATVRIIQARDEALREAENAKNNEAIAKRKVETLEVEMQDLRRELNQLNGYVNGMSSRQVTSAESHVVHVSPSSRKETVAVKKVVDGTDAQNDNVNSVALMEEKENSNKKGFWQKLFHKK